MPEQSSTNRDQNTLSYLSKFGSNLLDSVIKRFSNPDTARRNRFILLITTAILLTILVLPKQQFSVISFKPGNIATSDFRASKDYLIEDRALTEQRRKEAGNNAPVIYSLNDRIPSYIVDKLTQALTTVRTERTAKQTKNSEEWRALLAPILDSELSDVEIQALTRVKSDNDLLKDCARLLADLYQKKIVLDGKALTADAKRGIEILDNSGRLVEPGDPNNNHIEIGAARSSLSGWELSGMASSSDARRFSAIIARMLLPNLFYNREASESRVKTAMDAVRPIMFKVQKGEMIARVGERISSEQAHKINTIFGMQNAGNHLFSSAGIFSLIVVLFYFPYRFACKNIRKFDPTNKDILIISLLIVGSFFVFKTALQITHNIGDIYPAIDPVNYFYLFPFAAGAMMVRIFINSEVALVCCAILAPLLGIMFESNMMVVIYSMLGSIVGAHGVRHCTSRSTIYAAGLKVSVVNLAMALSFQTFSNSLFTMQTLYVALFAIASGIISAGFVSGFIPVIETLFQYTTDIKLLELANLNTPVLRELMVRAPGTYHHSVIVGNLVEAAAESINANPLLARVAAYYHDIGKASKPLYFIENQGGEENRHDKLTPSMSALILISHIKEGAELAREKHLGQPIIDIIRQHHGTALIKFFYERAKSQAGSGAQAIEEKDFRYPGPKPQTREAGIVMLADCVEAASRTLVNPTSDRIQGMVQKLINNVFIDGQLDECELTLKNLHEIAKSFNRVLNGIFHHRIAYPEPVHKVGGARKNAPRISGGGISNSENGDTRSAYPPEQPSEKASDSNKTVKNGSGDDIKRLGMS
jgi:putative nucleotidyltransferase with HDIG domain